MDSRAAAMAFCAGVRAGVSAAATESTNERRAAAKVFMGLKNSGREQALAATQGTTEQLVDRATGALRAGLAARTVMDTVAAALSPRHVGEDFLRRDVVYVYAVTEQANLCVGKRRAAGRTSEECSGASRGGDIDGNTAKPA